MLKTYFFFCGTGIWTGLPLDEPGTVGVTVIGAGPFAGAFAPAGSDCFAGALRSRIVAPTPALCVARIESAIDVHMNKIAESVVAFESSVAEPRGPKAVCEPIPPKAPARSAALPLCRRITTIKNRHTAT